MNMLSDTLLCWQNDYAPSAYLLAFSGGRDSVALLHALSQATLSAPLTLCHVHHGWHKDADDWAAWCVDTAMQYGLPCEVLRLHLPEQSRTSREALAREGRYQALGELLPPRGVLLTAHHQDDQAETFLLAALRGSGLQGLAGMPARKPFANGELWRPLLGVSRQMIDAYVQENALDFLDDPSNAETRYRRNALRLEVFPRLRAQGWQAEKTLSQSAQWLGEALQVQDMLLDKLLPEDVGNPLDFSPFIHEDEILQIALLRRFLQRMNAPMPPAPRVQEWLRQVREGGGEPMMRWADKSLVFYRGQVWLLDDHVIAAAPAFARETHWQGIGVLQVQGDCPEDAHWQLAQGGMRFHARWQQHGKTLKEACQQLGVPVALRKRMPVLCAGGRVLWAGYCGHARDAGVCVEWQEKGDSASIRADFFSDADRA